jgi:hypothetical protein
LLFEICLDVHDFIITGVLPVFKWPLHKFFDLYYANRISIFALDQLKIWSKRLLAHFSRLAPTLYWLHASEYGNTPLTLNIVLLLACSPIIIFTRDFLYELKDLEDISTHFIFYIKC